MVTFSLIAITLLPLSVALILNLISRILCMAGDQILQQEIKDSELRLSREKEESVYKRERKKRIELINWVLENKKNPEIEIYVIFICRFIN